MYGDWPYQPRIKKMLFDKKNTDGSYTQTYKSGAGTKSIKYFLLEDGKVAFLGGTHVYVTPYDQDGGYFKTRSTDYIILAVFASDEASASFNKKNVETLYAKHLPKKEEEEEIDKEFLYEKHLKEIRKQIRKIISDHYGTFKGSTKVLHEYLENFDYDHLLTLSAVEIDFN